MNRRFGRIPHLFLGMGMGLTMVLGPYSHAALDVSEEKSCNQYLVSKTQRIAKFVVQEACKMIEADIEFLGRKFRRIDMGVTGTVSGYTVKDEKRRYSNYLNAYPEFVFPQGGEADAQVFHGVARIKMEQGSGMTVMYPLEPSAWNGKLFVTAHGGGVSFARGNLAVWNRNLDPDDPMGDISKYERLMLEKGYGLAKTRRSSLLQGGDLTVTLDDGTVLHNRNVTEQPPLVMSFAKLASNVLQDRLGAQPRRTYWYGHSGGARPGRMVNYKAGLNVDDDGTPIVDGIIVDDAGAGLWLPIVMKDGKDVLFATDAEKQSFVPIVEISHLLYVNETPDNPPDWSSNNFLAKKRINAKTLREKGLWNKFRYYEIDGISHGGGEYLEDGKDGDVNILDMSRLMDGFIDLLDNWVEKGVAPPPTRSNWRELGDANKDNVVENGAIQMPEVACPLGVYHMYPPSRGRTGQGTTGFAPFTGEGLEPLDGRGQYRTSPDPVNVSIGFVDMNHNNYRDFVETVSEAWQRLGLLKPNEPFSRQRYVQCVAQAADKLVAEKLFLPRTGEFYKEQSRTMPLPEE